MLHFCFFVVALGIPAPVLGMFQVPDDQRWAIPAGPLLTGGAGQSSRFFVALRRTTSPGSHVARAFAPQKSDGVPRVGGQPILASTAVKVQQSLVGSLDQYGVQCT